MDHSPSGTFSAQSRGGFWSEVGSDHSVVLMLVCFVIPRWCPLFLLVCVSNMYMRYEPAHNDDWVASRFHDLDHIAHLR